MDAAAQAAFADPGAVGEGEGGTPLLQLAGFRGPLDVLLALARNHQVDLARLPVAALADQLVAALQQADRRIPLSRKGDWLVMAAWLLLLRSRLLLPVEAPAQHEARNEAENLRGRLLDLQAAQALASWLERRPQLGRDVFPRGQPEPSGTVAATQYEGDVIEFLWACLAQFDDGLPRADINAVYRPPCTPSVPCSMPGRTSCGCLPMCRKKRRSGASYRGCRQKTIARTDGRCGGAPPSPAR